MYFDGLYQKFARLVDPMNMKMEKDQPFHFGGLNWIKMDALKTLQQWLLSPLVLALPKQMEGIHFTVTPVASNSASSYYRQSKRQTNSMGLCSRLSNRAKQAYNTTQREFFRSWMGRPTVERVSWRVGVYSQNESPGTSMETQYDRCDRRIGKDRV